MAFALVSVAVLNQLSELMRFVRQLGGSGVSPTALTWIAERSMSRTGVQHRESTG